MCETSSARSATAIPFSTNFLVPLGAVNYASSNWSNLGSYTSLKNTVAYFRDQGVDSQNANSFSHASVATYGGWSSTNLLTPGLREAQCRTACRCSASAVGGRDSRNQACNCARHDWHLRGRIGRYPNLRRELDDDHPIRLSQGVIPVLSTIPDIKLSPDPTLVTRVEEYNQIIADVAGTNNVPLWNLSAALSSLPNQGLGSNEVHLSVGPDGSGDFATTDLSYGMNVRNLTAIEVLDKLVKVVEQNAAADPTPASPRVSATPFLAAIYQSILQRKIDIYGQAAPPCN